MTIQASEDQSVSPNGLRLPDAGQIKTILVPIAGSETDRTVLATALALARPMCAHLEFLHLRLNLVEAAHSSHVDFCQGTALHDALSQLQRHQSNLSRSATNFAQQFCRDHGISERATPEDTATVTAHCVEKTGPALETLLFHARHSDLIVLGRPQHADGMPPDLIADLLLESGRPLLITPATVSMDILGTVVVGWKETAAAARAANAALPILQRARHVVLVNVAEDNTPGSRALEHLSAQLAWHGIAAEVRRVGDGVTPASELLAGVAAESKAGLLVVGGFGHSRLRETVFGGVTRSLIDQAALPVFITH